MTVLSILAGSHNDNTRQSLYSSYGTGITTITVPYNVTRISAICIGGGGGGAGADPGRRQGNQGGGGGALCYGQFNVYPGETLTITVGAQGAGGASTKDGSNGGISSITRGTIGSGTLLLQANGGLGGIFRFDPADPEDNPINGGTYIIGVGVTNYGGGNGGSGGTGGGNTDPVVNPNAGGGGGTGGYAGTGGNGGNVGTGIGSTGGIGTGGGGGGGAGYSGTGKGYGGGGVGPDGTAFISNGLGGGRGGVGSGGQEGWGSGYTGVNVGGLYGGGGGAASNSATGANLIGSNGGAGVVRLVWGPERKYPFISAGYPVDINP